MFKIEHHNWMGFGMEYGLLTIIALIIAGAVAGGLSTTWGVHRRALRLEYRVGDLEERMLTLGNREKSRKRWDREQSIEDELMSLSQSAAAPQRRARFSNDPVEPEL